MTTTYDFIKNAGGSTTEIFTRSSDNSLIWDDMRQMNKEIKKLTDELEELQEKYKKLRLSKMVWDCLLSFNERFCSIIDDWDEPTKEYVDGWVQMFKDQPTIKKHLYQEWSAGW